MTLNVIAIMRSKKTDSSKSIREPELSLKSQEKRESVNGNNNSTLFYPQFAYTANELSAFIFSVDTFTILLKEGGIVNYTPDNAETFRQWLQENNIRDIKRNEK